MRSFYSDIPVSRHLLAVAVVAVFAPLQTVHAADADVAQLPAANPGLRPAKIALIAAQFPEDRKAVPQRQDHERLLAHSELLEGTSSSVSGVPLEARAPAPLIKSETLNGAVIAALSNAGKVAASSGDSAHASAVIAQPQATVTPTRENVAAQSVASVQTAATDATQPAVHAAVQAPSTPDSAWTTQTSVAPTRERAPTRSMATMQLAAMNATQPAVHATVQPRSNAAVASRATTASSAGKTKTINDDWLGEPDPHTRMPWGDTEMDLLSVRKLLQPIAQAAATQGPSVSQARSEHLAAMSDTQAVKGQRWPQVDISSNSRSYALGGDRNWGGSSSTNGVGASIVTPLYDFGRLNKTITSYDKLADAAEAHYESALNAASADAVLTFVELAKDRLLLQASQQHVDRLTGLTEMLSDIVAVDTGRRSELTQARARLLQAQTSHEALLATIRNLEIRLQKQTGMTTFPLVRTSIWKLEPEALSTLLAGLDVHPDVMKAKDEAESSDAMADSIKASAWPQLNWVVSKSTARDGYGRAQPWETYLTLTWGAFRGGATQAQRQSALSKAEAGRQRAAQARLDVEYGIKSSEQDATTLLQRANDYADLVRENDLVRRAFFQQWYHLGRRTLLDVLSAENEFYASQTSEVSSRLDGYGSIIKTYAQAGTLNEWLER
jgi:adhesin transport system outer membrane protein